MKKFFVVVAIIFVIGIGVLLSFTYIIEGRNYPLPNEFGNIVIEDMWVDSNGIIDGEDIYVPYRIIKEYINPDVIVSVEEKRIYLPLSQNSYRFENQETEAFVKDEEFKANFNLKEIDGELYAPISLLKGLLGIDVEYITETNIIAIDSLTRDKVEGVALKKGNVIEKPKLISRRIAPLKASENMVILGEVEGYYYIRNNEGLMGYSKKTNISILTEEVIQEANHFPIRDEWKANGKLGLVWDYVYQASRDRREEEKLRAIDVLSPTWFKMSDSEGSIVNNGDHTYVADAHGKGYKVWGLVTNGFDPDITSAFLSNRDAQGNFIRQILFYSGLYNLDGINIDFENVHYKDQDALTEFVGEFTQHLKRENLIVSIDVTIPSSSPNWSMVYDRVALGKIVDYVAVMTYDEHWAASPKSGSVASIGWVERGIKATLELVPPEKILLGIPFYARVWEEEQHGNKLRVSSKAYGMERIKEILLENNAEIEWNEAAGQYYAEYISDGKTYKVWIEDERSLALKTTLVEKYNLAGIAAWRKDFEQNKVWDPLALMIRDGKSYNEILMNLGTQ